MAPALFRPEEETKHVQPLLIPCDDFALDLVSLVRLDFFFEAAVYGAQHDVHAAGELCLAVDVDNAVQLALCELHTRCIEACDERGTRDIQIGEVRAVGFVEVVVCLKHGGVARDADRTKEGVCGGLRCLTRRRTLETERMVGTRAYIFK